MRGPTPSYPFLLDTCCREQRGLLGRLRSVKAMVYREWNGERWKVLRGSENRENNVDLQSPVHMICGTAEDGYYYKPPSAVRSGTLKTSVCLHRYSGLVSYGQVVVSYLHHGNSEHKPPSRGRAQVSRYRRRLHTPQRVSRLPLVVPYIARQPLTSTFTVTSSKNASTPKPTPSSR